MEDPFFGERISFPKDCQSYDAKFSLICQSRKKTSSTDWASVLRDSSLMFETLVALFLSLALLGVPLLSNGFGITAAGSWQSVTVALIILAASGYVFIQIVSDLFDKGSRILMPPTVDRKRWKPLMVVFLFLVLCGVLIYTRLRRGDLTYGS